MTQLAIRLNDDDLEVLDAAAAAAGVTRSEAARRAIRALGEPSGRPDPDAELRRIVDAWVDLRAGLPRALKANDSWIAATALALDIPLLTCDADFDAAAGIIDVVRM